MKQRPEGEKPVQGSGPGWRLCSAGDLPPLQAGACAAQATVRQPDVEPPHSARCLPGTLRGRRLCKGGDPVINSNNYF